MGAMKKLHSHSSKLFHGKCISTPNYLKRNLRHNQTAHMQHFITKLFKVEKSLYSPHSTYIRK